MLTNLTLCVTGTKNAYTTLRSGDVITYKLDEPIDGKSVRLGTLSGDGKDILPLCNIVEQGVDFVLDPNSSPISAEKLRKEGKLLRIISSDRKGDGYVIEEYLDEEIYIPALETTAAAATSNTNHNNVVNNDISALIKLAETQLATSQHILETLRSTISGSGNSFTTTNTITTITTSDAPAPVGPYSQAVKAGDMLYLSGSIGLDPVSKALVPGGVEAQAKQV
jgi:hypothetical protein